MHSSWEEAEEKNLVEQYSLIFRGFEGLQELKKRKKKKTHKKTSLISYAGRVDAPWDMLFAEPLWHVWF